MFQREKNYYRLCFLFVLILLACLQNSLAFEVSRRTETFERILDPLVDKQQIPGYYFSVNKNGSKVYERVRGFADIELALIPSEDTLYSIQGFTSLFTALSVLKLADEKTLKLSDPLVKYIPEFSEVTVAPDGSFDTQMELPSTPITLKHLLTNTSGLTRGQGRVANDIAENLRKNEIMTLSALTNSVWGDLKGQVAALTEMPLVSHPGETFHPSSGYDVLARVIEIVTGQPFSKAMNEILLKPLNLSDTTFYVPDADRSRLARMYSVKVLSSSLGQKTTTFQPTEILQNQMKNFGLSRDGYESGSSGLISTAKEVRVLLELVINKGKHKNKTFISEEMMEEILVHQLDKRLGDSPMRRSFGPMGKNTGFSSGLAVRWKPNSNIYEPKDYDFYFWGGLANTVFWIDVNNRISGIFLTQTLPFRFPPFEMLEKIADRTFNK